MVKNSTKIKFEVIQSKHLYLEVVEVLQGSCKGQVVTTYDDIYSRFDLLMTLI